MLHIDECVHKICSYAKAKGWSAEEYAREAEIPPSTARDVLKNRGNATRKTLRAMEGVVPRDFEAPAGDVSPEGEDS